MPVWHNKTQVQPAVKASPTSLQSSQRNNPRNEGQEKNGSASSNETGRTRKLFGYNLYTETGLDEKIYASSQPEPNNIARSALQGVNFQVTLEGT